MQGAQALKLDMVHGKGLQVCTLNVRTLTATGAATLLDKELARLDIGIAGLQEVRWLGSGELSAGDRKLLWSGGPDGGTRQYGVALAITHRLYSSLLSWKPISDRLLMARFAHTRGFLSVVVTYAPTEDSSAADKDTFYRDLDEIFQTIHSRDVRICLGDFNAVSGTDRIPEDQVIGPFSNVVANDNSDRFVGFCRDNGLRIAGTWFRLKDIHRWSWYSNDGVTRKEIDHVLVGTRWRALKGCRVTRSLEIGSDHKAVCATRRLHLKRAHPRAEGSRRYDSDKLDDPVVAAQFAGSISLCDEIGLWFVF